VIAKEEGGNARGGKQEKAPEERDRNLCTR